MNLKNLFSVNNSLILGISGGQDSNVLSKFLHIFTSQYNLKIFLVYCNHFSQQDAILNQYNLIKVSYLNEEFLTVFLPFRVLKSEKQSKIWRYTCFQRVAIFSNTYLVATGHTNTDLIESFLFYLIRGSGSNIFSISNMEYSFNSSKFNVFSLKKQLLTQVILKRNQILASLITLIRPLQFLNRYEIYHLYCYLKLPLWVDQTNFSMRYSRNRIRYQLLPLLRFYYHLNIDNSIYKFITILADEIKFLDKLTLKLQKTRFTSFQHNSFSYSFSFFFSCPYIFQKRLLFAGLHQIKFPGITLQKIEILIKIIYTCSYKESFTKKKIIFFPTKSFRLIILNNFFRFENF